MNDAFQCPDCGALHDEPGEAALGFRVRCLDCRIEIELAAEIVADAKPLAA